MPPVNDIAGFANVGTMGIQQLFAGESPIHTDAGVATTTVAKYQVVKKTLGTQIAAVATVGADTGKDYVIAAQPAIAGQALPYFDMGHFNHAVLVWPTDLETLAKRRAFFAGTPIVIGHLV